MTKPGGWRHSAEAKAKISAKNRARFADPAERARVREAIKARMADPAVRQRIRDGIARAAGLADSLEPLRRAWRDATPDIRRRFLDELLLPVCTASPSQSHDRSEAK